jgi:hypothetical protein
MKKMNERIKQLMLEAGYAAPELAERANKLVELIVRECVEQCNINFVGTVGTHPSAHNRGVKKCIDNIKEHFGVLE